ncbi:MAG: class II aldolase/adducin family protein [Deltaproteobacteria bacterium]|nr:class II aldolase/adducin family protein [Deltaproteobacteria bacterium]
MPSDLQLRVDLIETARALLRAGLVEGTAGNLSVRSERGLVLMTPTSLAYETMTPDDIALCDLAGNVLEGARKPTTEKALHLAVLRAYPELGAVIHSHAKFASMFAVARQPIPCVIEEFQIYVGGEVPVADYRLTGSDALGEECARHLAERAAVLMANHGLLAAGRDLAQAHHVTALVERTAEIVAGARSLGRVEPLPAETLARFAPVYSALRKRR